MAKKTTAPSQFKVTWTENYRDGRLIRKRECEKIVTKKGAVLLDEEGKIFTMPYGAHLTAL